MKLIHHYKSTLTFLLVCFLTLNSFAQGEKLTIEDAVIGLSTKYRVENISQLRWIPDSRNFSKVNIEAEDPELIQSSASGKEKVILKLSKLNSLLKLSGENKLSRFPGITWTSNSEFRINHKASLYAINPSNSSAELILNLDPEGGNTDIDKESSNIAFTKDDNLFVQQHDEITAVTKDGGKGIVYGTAVHRFEFGISKGTFWSPDGTKLAFYRKDESMVTEYPLVDVMAGAPAQLKNIRYPMAGQSSHHASVGVYDLKNGKTIYLDTGEPKEQYLTNVSWDPNGKSIYVAVVNRGQNHMKLEKYDSKKGELITTLFEEKNDKYVEPEHGPIFIPGKKGAFLWNSERGGLNNLYYYDSEGLLIRNCTPGNVVVTSFIGFDKRANYGFFSGVDQDSPMNENIYKFNFNTGSVAQLNKSTGVHRASLNDDGTYLIDNYSSNYLPRKIEILETKKGKSKNVLLEAKDKLSTVAMSKINPVELTADDGTKLYGKLILPADFDESKKYPVIVYLYGGPHLQLVRNRYPASGNLWYDYLTQNGYIVFTMDNRGSANRGLEFEQAVFRNFGEKEMDDQLKGVEFLKKLNFVDADRLGVHGWSFGGFMTTSLMTRHPEVFKAGVAGGPVIDWSYYEIMYTERYMDTPEENPEGFESANLKNYAKDLQGRLMIIHGAQDDVVVWQHSLSFVRQCVEDGILLDYFVYPTHPHNVRGKDRVHLMRKITQYFDDHLK